MPRTDAEAVQVLLTARDKCHDQLAATGLIGEVEQRQRMAKEIHQRLELIEEQLEKYEAKVDATSASKKSRNFARIVKPA